MALVRPRCADMRDGVIDLAIVVFVLYSVTVALRSRRDASRSLSDSSYWSNDLYKGWWVERVRKRAPSRRELVLVARLSNAGILALALLIMANLGTIQTAWQMSLLSARALEGC